METQPGKIEGKEQIVKAAIQLPNGEIFTGKNHNEIFKKVYEKFPYIISERVEGFITNTGRFVSRLEAGEIAFKAGQTKKLENRLQSQDLKLE